MEPVETTPSSKEVYSNLLCPCQKGIAGGGDRQTARVAARGAQMHRATARHVGTLGTGVILCWPDGGTRTVTRLRGGPPDTGRCSQVLQAWKDT